MQHSSILFKYILIILFSFQIQCDGKNDLLFMTLKKKRKKNLFSLSTNWNCIIWIRYSDKM